MYTQAVNGVVHNEENGAVSMKAKRRKPVKTCYMCEEVATTREHVPPQSFFPEGYRDNLVTVPSCNTHNNRNSDDVDYVRTVIIGYIGITETTTSPFEAIRRSFRRNPKLFDIVFREAQPIDFNNESKISFETVRPKIDNIMRAIAYALFFKDTGQKYPHNWWVEYPSLISSENEANGLRDLSNERLRAMLYQVPVIDRPINNSSIFKYGVYQDSESQIAYKMTFYESFIVYALGNIGIPDPTIGNTS